MTPLTSIFLNDGAVRELGPNLYTAFPYEMASAPYDRRAVAYDALVGRSIYHRVFWGTSAAAYTFFGRQALEAAGEGHFAEIGCGSLLFTAQMYRNARNSPVLLVDRSIAMLRRGLARAGSDSKRPPEVVALHADAAALPVRSAVFSSILSLNLLHVPCNRTGIASEWTRILMPGGRLFVSSLVRTARWSNAYMSFLHRAGELGSPLSLEELVEVVAGRWAVVESTAVEGSMCFLVARHAG